MADNVCLNFLAENSNFETDYTTQLVQDDGREFICQPLDFWQVMSRGFAPVGQTPMLYPDWGMCLSGQLPDRRTWETFVFAKEQNGCWS